MQEKIVLRSDYSEYAFSLQSVVLNFDLYDDETIVASRMQLKRKHDGDLYLYGDELELISLIIDDKVVAPDFFKLEKGDLIIANCPDEFTLTVVTRIKPQKNTALSGLYRSNNLFCTQCEAEGFRRITYFPDRPDVLTTFTTRITANKKEYPILLSNGNLIDRGDDTDGRHWALWQDPFKKPSYLFALVAGDLACISDKFTTMSGRVIDLYIYVEVGNEDKCAHAMESLKKSMRWDEEKYGREYDLDLFMIVAVSDFNMGAMENKGLNIFNSKFILARPENATDQDYADIEGVVAHEYFHNWTGNRVTCRDWFQLSLKEGLTVFRDQEFSRDMNSRNVNRIKDVKILRNSQFPEDMGAMAHPVRPESYLEINNFYTSTIYNKGAEVIRMQHTLLGEDGFRRGMDLYFERHDGMAVTIDDFVAAMEDANDVDFSQFKLWYSQAGTPVVKVVTKFNDDCLQIILSQSCRATPECAHKKPFHIPVKIALFNSDGSSVPLAADILELRDYKEVFSFHNLSEKPIVSLFGDFSAPVVIDQEQSDADLLALLRFESNGYAKWEAAQTIALNSIKHCLAIPKKEWQVSMNLANAYQHILEDESLDAALRAELLTPPTFEDALAKASIGDVDLIESARDFYCQSLGVSMFDAFESMYHKLSINDDQEMSGNAYGRRKLRNTCIWFMMKADETRAIKSCQLQFDVSKTMTDKIASFAMLANVADESIRNKAIADFYAQWSHDELVMDKWFSVQASAIPAGALMRIRKLLKHQDFNMKNPNKVRALIGAFSQLNPRHFHAIDGSGYAFLTEMVLAVDAINPQIAARLVTPFTRGQRLDSTRQKLMQQQLKILSSNKLSRDVEELVSKGLNG